MKWHSRVLGSLTILLACCVLPSKSPCQVIFVDPCGAEIPQFQSTNLTVWVCLENEIRDGISGAQFRIAGFPAGWLPTITPGPGVTLQGDVFGAGVLVGSDSPCLTSTSQYLELFTVSVFAPTFEADLLLAATAIEPPLAPPFDCPFVTLCDAPAFTKVCCRGNGARINVREGPGCPLAVESRTWSEIKQVYRE